MLRSSCRHSSMQHTMLSSLLPHLRDVDQVEEDVAADVRLHVRDGRHPDEGVPVRLLPLPLQPGPLRLLRLRSRMCGVCADT